MYGFVAGLLGAFLAISPGLHDLPTHLIRVVLIAIATGLAAAKFGERVWHYLTQTLDW